MELNFLTEIDRQYAGLTRTFRKIADYLKKEYMQLPFQSIQEVAQAAEVSPASVHRFCIQLGYTGFPALQREIQTYLQKNLVEHESEAYRNWKESGNSILKEQVEKNTQVLQEMMTEDLDKNFELAVEAIKSARRVYIIGLRASYCMAVYMHNLLMEYMDNVILLTLGVDDIYDRIAGAKPEDVLLAVGFKPYTNYTVEILKHFRKVGAKTVAISDKPSSPLAINADISLLPGNKTPSYGFVMAVTIIKALGISVSRIHDPEVLEYYEKKKDFLLKNDILM